MIWKTLGIDETKDIEIIRAAYREKLRFVNPEDDQEGFKELRTAYEEALRYAEQSEEDDAQPEMTAVHKNEVDRWIDRVNAVYENVVTRRDVNAWKALFKDAVCEDLDTEIEAGEKLLVFFMSHSYMPQAIWQFVNSRFAYKENYEQLKERFPENYLDYINWQIDHPNFIDFDLFDGKTDDKVDEYINTLYELKNIFEEGELSEVKRKLDLLYRFDVTHPFTQVEEARYLLKMQELEGGDYKEQALEIMEELDFEYSDNSYIERIYAMTLMENAKYDKALTVLNALLEKDAKNYGALLGKARCAFLQGELEDAKEQIEDILEDRVQDVDALNMLDGINEKLVEKYNEMLREEQDREIVFKLGWCLYQQKKFEEGIQLLDDLEPGEDYDYVNLRCRLYLANENYVEAYPLTKVWLKQIEESVEDGSKEMTKRKNRLSLAHFSLGICMWEIAYKKQKENAGVDCSEELEAAAKYIAQAVEEETNLIVALSYMEQLARFYLEEKKYDKCIMICDGILAKDRGFFPAYVHRQKAHFELKNAKEVIDDFYMCRDLYPSFARPYVLAAEVFIAFEQYDDAKQVLESAKEAGIESDGLELCRIKCLHYEEFSKENAQRAIEALEALKDKINLNQDDEKTDIENMSELYRELAILKWDLDLEDQAIATLDAYLTKEPNDFLLLRTKVDILNSMREFEKATNIAERIVQLEGAEKSDYVRLGTCYERMDRQEEAVTCYTNLLNEDPMYVPAIRRMMYLYSYWSNKERDLDMCQKAIEYATRMIELTSTAEPYVERGNLYIDVYDLEKAVADCEQAIRLDSEAYYAYNNLGCALLKLRRMEEAIPPLKHAIEMDPDKEYLPYLNLAECYALLGEYKKAIELYETVLNKWPRRATSWEDIAKLFRKMKQYDKAIEAYKRIPNAFMNAYGGDKKSDSYVANSIEAYCDIADTYAEAGDARNAQKYFKKAVQLLKSYKGNVIPDKLETIVEYYRDYGDLKKAAKYMELLYQHVEPGTYKYEHLHFTHATLLFEMGDIKQAATHAMQFLDAFRAQHGGEEKMLSALRYRPMYLYDFGIMYLCAGDTEKAKEYFEQIRDCKLCVTCEAMNCFEYYFGMGLVAELNGDTAIAIEYYHKAITLRGYYPCCERRLKRLE